MGLSFMSKLHNFKFKFRYYNNKMELNIPINDDRIVTIFDKVKNDNMDLRCLPTIITCLVSEYLKVKNHVYGYRDAVKKVIEQTVRHICGTYDIRNVDNFVMYFAKHNKWDFKDNMDVFHAITELLTKFGTIYTSDSKSRFE